MARRRPSSLIEPHAGEAAMRLLRIAEPLAVQEHRRDALSPKVGKEASELIILRWDRIGPARSHRRGAEPERRRAWGLR